MNRTYCILFESRVCFIQTKNMNAAFFYRKAKLRKIEIVKKLLGLKS